MSAMEPISTDDFPLDHEPIEDWQRVGAATSATDSDAGSRVSPADATTAFAELGSIAGADYGLWEMSAGAMRDVEGDEVFIVISGTGRIEFDEPDLPPVELSPGTLVHLEDGMKTRWHVDEAPLRKLFIAPSE
ncbi:cupin domain-containing protein [Brevibacterium sp. CBA3109]|uniref:Cupin domain-containing protein n=1 Tax=Brevibacterium koreense TaxID=3140787 RepID=A0AAU7UN01_9MICO